MAERYRKYGRTIRFERGVFVRAEEAGEAVEEGGAFRCGPIARDVELPLVDASAIEATVREIVSIVRTPLAIERLVVTEGVAEHRFGDQGWRETTRRVHLAITHATRRVLIDRGDFDLDDVRSAAAALPRAGAQRETPRIRLAPNVAAALLPPLVGLAPPNVRLLQSAGGIDGKGQVIEECDAARAGNWYRPSYRVRPVRMPLNLRAHCAVTAIDEDLPRAIALLAPVDRLTLHVLCTHRDRVFPAQVRVSRIDAITESAQWYPYAAGSFGAEMML